MGDTNVDLSSIRIFISAGEALPQTYCDDGSQKLVRKFGCIGTTEILHIFLSNRPGEVKPGASGRTVPGYDAKIVDDDGNEVPDGETGSLMIKGESLLKLYWRNPEKTAESLHDGWMYTGDTYYRDEDGFLFCCGRSDDMLKVRYLVLSREISWLSIPRYGGSCRRPRRRDELIKPEAFVVLNDAGDESDALKKGLLEHCKTGLARYKYPRWFNFLDDLPKTATGKIQRFRLRSD